MLYALFTPFPWSYSKPPRGAFSRTFALFFCNTVDMQMITPVKTVAFSATGCFKLAGVWEAPDF